MRFQPSMSMYAVISTGGKQYRVQPGDIVQIEKLEGDVGTPVQFEQVLFCSKPGAEKSEIWVGTPLLNGANVDGEIVGQGRGEKILIMKFKRRKQYRRKQGHRQNYTQVLVTGLKNGSGEVITLSDADKKAKLTSFQSHLKEKGEAFTPKTLGSRVRMKRAAAAPKKEAAAKSAAPKEAAPKEAAPKKATTAKKTAAKKTTKSK